MRKISGRQGLPVLEVDLLRGLSPPRQQLRRFDWRNDRRGVELPHGRPHGEDPQVARAREEVLAAPGAEARHAERDLA
jgi:hypothetical protein